MLRSSALVDAIGGSSKKALADVDDAFSPGASPVHKVRNRKRAARPMAF
jgi:hypothetical protein